MWTSHLGWTHDFTPPVTQWQMERAPASTSSPLPWPCVQDGWWYILDGRMIKDMARWVKTRSGGLHRKLTCSVHCLHVPVHVRQLIFQGLSPYYATAVNHGSVSQTQSRFNPPSLDLLFSFHSNPYQAPVLPRWIPGHFCTATHTWYAAAAAAPH